MIVRLTGGLGNQMFGYAFGRALSLRHNTTVQFHWMRSTWDYELDKYQVRIELVNPTTPKRLYTEPSFSFDPKAMNQLYDTYYQGYWQSPLYFNDYADVIRRDLTLKNSVRPEVEETTEMMRDGNSVFIHARRGDYTNSGTKEFHGVLGLDYYRSAMAYIESKVDNPCFYAFSDDPSWCLENLPCPASHQFNQHEDLYLMQQCRHGIGANSSFSWWANWLADRPGRINIAPKQWFMNPDISTNDLIPPHWIRL